MADPSTPRVTPPAGSRAGDGTGAPVFATILLVITLVLLAQLGSETRWVSGVQWPLQPRLWPALSLLGMAVASGWLLGRHSVWRMDWLAGASEILAWTRPLEFAAWFTAYAMTVPWLGYPATTVLFLAALGARVGIRSVTGQLALLAAGVCTVLIFRTLLSVKLPPGTVYEYLPIGLRNFMTLYF